MKISILTFISGCGRLYCGLCSKSAVSSNEFIEALVSELFPRRLVYCPSFYASGLEANIQKIRGQNARTMSSTFYPRCVQGTETRLHILIELANASQDFPGFRIYLSLSNLSEYQLTDKARRVVCDPL